MKNSLFHNILEICRGLMHKSIFILSHNTQETNFVTNKLQSDFTVLYVIKVLGGKQVGAKVRCKSFKAVFFNKISHKMLFNISNHCSINMSQWRFQTKSLEERNMQRTLYYAQSMLL